VVVDEVIGLRKHESAVVLKKGGLLPYDYLVLCTGSRYRLPVTSNEHILVVDPLVPAALQTYATLALLPPYACAKSPEVMIARSDTTSLCKRRPA
jgi:NADPH-dependent 2,4-dienoyl-CoA reductase/sulfur reductase-like enzyme